MRTGEVFALTWNDIDLENKIIKINKTVYSKIKDDKGRWFIGTPKTEGSCREVFICDTLYKILYNYKEKQKLLKKKYGRKYKKYGLEPIKNKLGKINEYKVKDIAEILGHSNIETTENYYISSAKETRKEVSIILDNIIESDVINQIINFEDFAKKRLNLIYIYDTIQMFAIQKRRDLV